MDSKTSPAVENELILENILKRLNVEDLLSCRLVCLKWAKLGSLILKDKIGLMVVNIVGYYEEKTKHRIHDFLKVKESSLKSSLKDYFPYDKFHLGEYGLDLGTSYINKFFDIFPMTSLRLSAETLNNTQISTFREVLMFHICQVVRLELDFPRYGYMEFQYLFPSKIWTLINPVLPNLKILILRLPEDRNEFTAQFFIDLFRAVPNLETLKIFGVHEKLLNFFLNSIVEIQHHPLKRLTDLEIGWGSEHPGEINQLHLDTLATIGSQYLKLKSLSLSSVTDNIQLWNQQLFFQAFVPTLEKLKINKFSYFSATAPFSNGKLKHLEFGELSELSTLDFIYESLPHLLTLTLGKVTSGLFGLNCLVPILLESRPHPLKKLVLPHALVDSAALSKILTGFSNLCRLELTADDNSLKAIYISMPQIEELTLFHDSKVTDEGITGFSQNISRQLYNDNCELCGEKTVDHLRQNSPWIGSLKKLKLFKMMEHQENGCPNNKISDVSVVFGFRYLQELKNLQIPKTWITNFSLYYFGKHYNLVHLDVSFCFWLTPPGIERLKEQSPHLQIKVKNWYKNLASKYSRIPSMSVPSEFYFMNF